MSQEPTEKLDEYLTVKEAAFFTWGFHRGHFGTGIGHGSLRRSAIPSTGTGYTDGRISKQCFVASEERRVMTVEWDPSAGGSTPQVNL